MRLFETFECGGHVCLAFERHGRSLEVQVDRGPLPVKRVREAAVSLLEAVRGLHAAGFVHTDIKAGNLLYDPKSGEVRLADLGSARRTLRQGALLGSREYTAPEVLVGAPLTPAVDIWSLGCCLCEMLTGRVLFDPRAVAERKYVEFDRRQGLLPGPEARTDEEEERAEQYESGAVVGGRYRVREVLGQGRFATVWTAEPVHENGSEGARRAPLAKIPLRRHDPREESTDAGRDKGEAWRRAKGADDLLDLALNYELAVLMARLCGPFPESLLRGACYRDSYFERDGELRFRPAIRRDPLRSRLRRQTILRGESLESATDFLSRLLELDPSRRAGIAEALAHPWLGGRGAGTVSKKGATIPKDRDPGTFCAIGRPREAEEPQSETQTQTQPTP